MNFGSFVQNFKEHYILKHWYASIKNEVTVLTVQLYETGNLLWEEKEVLVKILNYTKHDFIITKEKKREKGKGKNGVSLVLLTRFVLQFNTK